MAGKGRNPPELSWSHVVLRMSPSGHKQPLKIMSGERLLSGAYRPLRVNIEKTMILSVCFSQERSFKRH